MKLPVAHPTVRVHLLVGMANIIHSYLTTFNALSRGKFLLAVAASCKANANFSACLAVSKKPVLSALKILLSFGPDSMRRKRISVESHNIGYKKVSRHR
jgi:hypothetical protein